jgi:histidinol-phosphate phosphatase family protein
VKAVILAGGKGLRLAARTNGLPKPLIPVAGKPLLAWQLELLARHGAEQVTLLCGYGSDQIREFCGSGASWGFSLRCIEEPQALGTAGAVIAALDQLPDEFFVLYGDTMLNVDLRRMFHAHKASGARATLFLHPNDHPQDSDLVESDEHGRIKAIHGYPHPEGVLLPNQVNAALYVIKKSALRGYPVPDSPLDFAKHVFPRMLSEGVHLHGYRSPEYIKDLGTPARLDRVEADVLSGVVARSSLDVRRPAVFLDRDGTINEEVSYVTRPEQLKLLPGAAEAVVMLRDAGYRVVVITNQPVIARGDCDVADLLRIHDHLEMLLSREGAFLDGIYYCPHHPDKGFEGERAEYKFECNCRKPADGLVQQAARELNLDLGASWLIGDRTGDVQTAHKAGIRSVLLRTGIGGRDKRYPATPDYIFDDLQAAACHISEHANMALPLAGAEHNK